MEKFTISLFLCLLLFLLACNSPRTNENSGQVSHGSFTLESEFYKRFRGTIGDVPITVELTRKDSSIYGRMYYESVKVPIPIFGTITYNGEIHFDEAPSPDKRTGHFNGRFLSESQIEGEWYNPSKRAKVLKFKLTTAQDGVEDFEILSFNESKSWIYNGEELYGKLEYGDSAMASVYALVTQIKSPKSELNDRINKILLEDLCSSRFASLLDGPSIADCTFSNMKNKALVHLNAFNGDAEPITLEYTSSIRALENNIMCIEIYDGFDMLSHPRGGEGHARYFNIDMRTGEIIDLGSLLSVEEIKYLNDIIKQELLSGDIVNSDYYESEMDKILTSRTSNFVMDIHGLYFPIYRGEIAAYSWPGTEVFLSYERLKVIPGINKFLLSRV